MAEDSRQLPRPSVGQRYIATDNAQAIRAMCGDGYPVPQGVLYVTVERVYPEHEKAQVRPDGMWLTYDQLEQWFRPVNPEVSGRV